MSNRRFLITDSALDRYYALPLWDRYLVAKGRWEGAHEAYCATNGADRERAELENAEREKDYYLARLRETPEHKAAFGW